MSATRDAGRTGLLETCREGRIGRTTAGFLVAAFLVLIAVPPIHQTYLELSRTGRWRFLSLFEEIPTASSLKQFEETLSRDSELAARSRLAYQTLLTGALHQGNDKIFVGRHGFLFYQQEIELAAGPGFLRHADSRVRGTQPSSTRRDGENIVASIVDFADQLRALGMRLVFVPLPLKPFIYPEAVWPGYPPSAGPAWNQDREAFLSRLTRQGVDVVDVTDALWQARSAPDGDLFLKLDTHWSPRGLSVAADRLAAAIRDKVNSHDRSQFTTRAQSVTNHGDLLRILEVLPGSRLFEPQTVQIIQVLDGGRFASGDESSPVLLLGDSFTNIYRRKEMEWGEGAGLGEQLMSRLGVPVQVMAINGGGATGVREALAQKPRALRPDRLVVWACSARDLGDPSVVWSRVPLPKPD